MIESLRKVMKKNGAIGLAAPQIGVPLAAFVMELSSDAQKRVPKDEWKVREMATIPFTAVINPQIRVLDNTVIKFPESCESMKGYSAVVPRFYKIFLKETRTDLDEEMLEGRESEVEDSLLDPGRARNVVLRAQLHRRDATTGSSSTRPPERSNPRKKSRPPGSDSALEYTFIINLDELRRRSTFKPRPPRPTKKPKHLDIEYVKSPIIIGRDSEERRALLEDLFKSKDDAPRKPEVSHLSRQDPRAGFFMDALRQLTSGNLPKLNVQQQNEDDVQKPVKKRPPSPESKPAVIPTTKRKEDGSKSGNRKKKAKDQKRLDFEITLKLPKELQQSDFLLTDPGRARNVVLRAQLHRRDATTGSSSTRPPERSNPRKKSRPPGSDSALEYTFIINLDELRRRSTFKPRPPRPTKKPKHLDIEYVKSPIIIGRDSEERRALLEDLFKSKDDAPRKPEVSHLSRQDPRAGFFMDALRQLTSGNLPKLNVQQQNEDDVQKPVKKRPPSPESKPAVIPTTKRKEDGSKSGNRKKKAKDQKRLDFEITLKLPKELQQTTEDKIMLGCLFGRPVIFLVFFCRTLADGFPASGSKYHTVTRHVYLDVKIGNNKPDRVTIGLFGNSHPRTTENFVRLATVGINGDPSLSYRGTKFHRVIKRWGSKYHTVTRHVYLDVKIGNNKPDRVTIGLFGNSHPRTTENFVRLATVGINGDPSLSYRGTKFHRVIKRFMIQGGDVVNKDGTGRPWSALGSPMFEDEVFAVNHTVAGFVSMANSGPDTNACQFFITVGGAPWLDGKNVAFGKVKIGVQVKARGRGIVDENAASERSRPGPSGTWLLPNAPLKARDGSGFPGSGR
ncbi:unnamed protein product [Notodromas monacha]|uniref:PPIase cyclophilin-type domain-containing protein n=1 Tax=Notodromas monacha TaxID=399045 RepID=A0A7R9BY10_9CRUS|nr:unnamed protein product [Notodromas monacha]CAG0922502.1 unnamed protein product [Notodromas monacha]